MIYFYFHREYLHMWNRRGSQITLESKKKHYGRKLKNVHAVAWMKSWVRWIKPSRISNGFPSSTR